LPTPNEKGALLTGDMLCSAWNEDAAAAAATAGADGLAESEANVDGEFACGGNVVNAAGPNMGLDADADKDADGAESENENDDCGEAAGADDDDADADAVAGADAGAEEAVDNDDDKDDDADDACLAWRCAFKLTRVAQRKSQSPHANG
jgi:hypothetical protein